MEEERWVKLRKIVQEEVRAECERISNRILEVLEKHKNKKPKTKSTVTIENGTWVGITEEQLSAWRAAYGLCDVDLELKKAAAWLLSNPESTPKNYPRFLNGWLAKNQDRSSIRSIPTRSEPVKPKKCAYCERPPTGSVSGIDHCSAHLRDAMDGVPVKAA